MRTPGWKHLVFFSVAIIAFATGPALIPFRINTDLIIAIFKHNPDANFAIPRWYGPGFWLAYILLTLEAMREFFVLCWHLSMMDQHTSDEKATCAYCHDDRQDVAWLFSLIYTTVASCDLVCWRFPFAGSLFGRQHTHVTYPAVRAAAVAATIGSGVADLMLVTSLIVIVYKYKELTWLKRRALTKRRLLLLLLILNAAALLGMLVYHEGNWVKDLSMKHTKPVMAESVADTHGDSSRQEIVLFEVYAFRVAMVDLSFFTEAAAFPWHWPWFMSLFWMIFCGAHLWPETDKREPPRSNWETICRMLALFLGSWLIMPAYLSICLTVFSFIPPILGAWSSAWLALTPGSGYFPYTGIPLMDLGQLRVVVGALGYLVYTHWPRVTGTYRAWAIASTQF